MTALSEIEQLLPYATEAQAARLRAVLEHGSQRAAHRAGCDRKGIQRALKSVRRAAALKGWSPQHDMTKPVPDGFSVGRVSTNYNADGEVTQQWVIARPDDEQREQAMRVFVETLCENVTPRKPVPAPKHAESDLMVGYPVGDHHVGMYAHAAETGGDYDLKIATDVLNSAVGYLVDQSPPTEHALLAILGDFLHIDSRQNRTPMSGHQLDVDTRYSKVVGVASESLAYTTERLLRKHQHIEIKVVPGNHDPDGASWLALVLKAWFRNEPRVTVDTSPSVFLYHQFGLNMICMTHGHTVKLEEVPAVMAAQQPEMWGSTKYRVAWTGHVHHRQRLGLKEGRGAISESFGVLPPNDAYGASRGFVSQREMHAITFKRSGGELGRTTYNADLH